MTRLLAVSALAEVAGGENELLRTLPALGRRGYSVRLAVPARGELRDRARALGLPTVILPIGPPEALGLRAVPAVALATRFLVRTDVVWLNGLSTQRLVPALAMTRRPAVLRVNNPLPEPPAWWRRRRYWDIVRAISVPSQATARECITAGAPPELVRVTPPPAWGERGSSTAAERPDDSIRVGFVGSLEPRKGVMDLIWAADLFLSAHPEATLTVIGQAPPGDPGRYASQLREAASSVRGAERISFKGYVPDASAEMAAFDLLVIPSQAEPLASVVGEAAAAGVPVVATSVGGLPEGVADGGLIVPPGRPDALAAAISSLLDDPERRRQLSEQARAGAIRFDPERFADDMDALLRQVAR